MTTLPQQPVAPAFVTHAPRYRGPGFSITISSISYIVKQNLRADFPLAGEELYHRYSLRVRMAERCAGLPGQLQLGLLACPEDGLPEGEAQVADLPS